MLDAYLKGHAAYKNIASAILTGLLLQTVYKTLNIVWNGNNPMIHGISEFTRNVVTVESTHLWWSFHNTKVVCVVLW